MKTVINHDYGDEFVQAVRDQFPQLDLHLAYTDEAAADACVDAKILIGELSPRIFAAAGELEYHHYVGIGFNHFVAIPGFRESELLVTNTRETHVIPMADYVFACVLAFAHCLPDHVRDQQSKSFEKVRYLSATRELPGSTMGILAMGDIGRAVAQRAQGFEMDVYAVDLQPMDPPPGVREVWPVSRLDEMLALSDWLVITAPLTEQTKDLIGAEQLRRLKGDCHVVIVSRGGIVNEEALIEALQAGRIAGAAVDAFTTEPLPPDSPWWDLPNVIVTPHSSAGSPALWERRKEVALDNLRRYLSGRPLRYVCDKALGY